MQVVQLDGESIYDTIYRYEQEKRALPARVPKPKEPINKTSQQMREYADNLEIYESALKAWKAESFEVVKFNTDVDTAIAEFIKNAAGLYTIPESSQNKVWDKAWRDGHSSGFHEVYQHLCELVELF